ncbi:glycoside hydrolase family 13 protein [Bacillus testis]|uniref:glycoside hydrolase family 13 protein n=1 Tax=Bacillus testis TaxID=1622072 RepID=UPI00067F07CB|nr:alpha-glucosidase [Bacillus testis]
MERKWWKEAVCYQIYPRSFKDSNGDGIGDLNGILSKLDYLKELGIDVLWICPFYSSPNADNGYDISDYQNIMLEFGTMEDFDRLLEECHQREMKVILDLVINHTSDEHPWFIESRSSRESEKRDWYIWRDGKNGREPNNWESIFSGSAWEWDRETKAYYMHLFAAKQPDLNWENKDVRQAIYEMIRWWLDKGIDGFRVDAISHIKKRPGLPDMPNPAHLEYVPAFDMHTNQEGIHEFLQEMKKETFDRYDIMTVGEANGVRIDQANEWVGEEQGAFNMIFQFEHLDLWRKEAAKNVDVVALKKTLSKWQKGLEGVGWNALFFENHDQPRSVSVWGNDGEYWSESSKMLAACYFFMQGTPFIYQGQEIGMTNVRFENINDYDDIGMKNLYALETAKGREPLEIMEIIWQSGRDNSRTPMQWNSQPNAGFTSGTPWMKVNPNYKKINVEAQKADEHSIYHFYKKMIQLRKKYDIFIYGSYELLAEDHPSMFVYKRALDGETAYILCNFSDEETVYNIEDMKEPGVELVLHNMAGGAARIDHHFAPYEARVYLEKK